MIWASCSPATCRPSKRPKPTAPELCRALDRLEALIQHNEADIASWLPLEYDLQQTYGLRDCAFDPWVNALRQLVLKESLDKIAGEAQKLE